MLRRFLEAWRGFWSWLFGGRRKKRPGAASAEEPQAPGPAARRFADFVDPFAAGTADRYPPDELVRYSFEALEAWARDNGLPREPDQTPYEFSQRIGGRVESLAGDVRTLSDLYYQAAFARGSLSAAGVQPLAKFWTSLRAAGNDE
jgi:DMSO/TMAO reductase YedYZ molybdopterin-dependent catalytic subunit